MMNGAARKAYDEARRARSRGPTRPQVLRTARVTKSEKRHLALVYEQTPDDPNRPRTRADCENVPRPCPYVSCRHHLYLDVNPRTGSIKIGRPDLEPDELERSCALDIADEGPATLDEIAAALNISHERVRQIEEESTRKLRLPLARTLRDT